MPRVVHFEIYADDMERAEQFYHDIFDWTVDKWEGENGFVYSLVSTGDAAQPGINGGLLQRPDPAAVTTIMLEVPSIDDYAGKITDGGGTVTVPKFAVPGVGYAAYFTDTEGNPFGIFQDDSSAA